MEKGGIYTTGSFKRELFLVLVCWNVPPHINASVCSFQIYESQVFWATGLLWPSPVFFEPELCYLGKIFLTFPACKHSQLHLCLLCVAVHLFHFVMITTWLRASCLLTSFVKLLLSQYFSFIYLFVFAWAAQRLYSKLSKNKPNYILIKNLKFNYQRCICCIKCKAVYLCTHTGHK